LQGVYVWSTHEIELVDHIFHCDEIELIDHIFHCDGIELVDHIFHCDEITMRLQCVSACDYRLCGTKLMQLMKF
jgi:hypothetical protein